MTDEQVDRLLVALEAISENLEGLSNGVWEVNENLGKLIGHTDSDKAFLRTFDLGRD